MRAERTAEADVRNTRARIKRLESELSKETYTVESVKKRLAHEKKQLAQDIRRKKKLSDRIGGLRNIVKRSRQRHQEAVARSKR